MAASAWTWFGRGKAKLLDANIDFGATALLITLHTSGTPFSAGHDFSTLASASAVNAQLASSNGYDKGGQTASSHTIALSGNNAVVSAAGVSWSANGGTLGGALVRFAVARMAASANADGIPFMFSALSTAEFTVADTNALKLNGGRASSAKLFNLV